MKFKRTRGRHTKPAQPSGFRTKVKGRKELRKQMRQQKKQNRALRATHSARRQGELKNETVVKSITSTGKIKHLQAFVDAEKVKLRKKAANDSKLPVKGKKQVTFKITSKDQPTDSDDNDTGGFKATTSNSDRLSRLQAFVNQEAGISQKKPKKKKFNEAKSDTLNSEDNKSSLIKDKVKLNALRDEQQGDTREINKLAKLLRYRKPQQKKKIAPIFADDFGSLLEDIDSGNMTNAEKYKIDDAKAQDSEEEFENDMALALGQELKKKKDKIKLNEESGNLDDDNMRSDYDEFESGFGIENGESDEDEEIYGDGEMDDDEEIYGDGEMDDDEGENDGEEGFDYGDENSEEEQNSSVFRVKGHYPKNYDQESDEDVDKEGEEDGEREEQDEEEEEEEEEDEDEEEEEEDSFLDSQAVEDSMEESDDDVELVHDPRKEEEYAFEGGSGYYSKPEILKNGQENDIDRYSSNSEDDEDLDDFIVDDNDVEFEDVSDELPNEFNDSPSPKKKKSKRRHIVVTSDDSDDNEVCENKSGGGDGDDDNYLVPSKVDRKLKIKGKIDNKVLPEKKTVIITSTDESDSDNTINDNQTDSKYSRKRKREMKKKSRKQTNKSDGMDKSDVQIKSILKQEILNSQALKKDKNKKNKFMDLPDVSDTTSDEGESRNKVGLKKKSRVSFDLPEISLDENDHNANKKKTKEKKCVQSRSNKDYKNLSMSEDSDDGSCTEEEDSNAEWGEFSDCEPEEEEGNAEVADFSDCELEEEDSNARKGKFSDCEQDEEDSNGEWGEFSDCEPEEEEVSSSKNEDNQTEKSDLKEDIYGRLRDKDGNVVTSESRGTVGGGKYVPPALRKLMALNTDQKKKEQLASVKKSLKGLLNRLAESNMGGIISQIEGMYLKYSRNDMNETLTSLLMESLVAPALTPDRLVQEHTLLVAVLSTNVGNEVGAHILNEFVLRWNDEMEWAGQMEEVKSKELENLLLFIANLYNFRVMDAQLVYDILNKLAAGFSSKEVELILLVLRSVGFTLRKDNPLALKSLISKIQTQAAEAQSSEEESEFSRVRFMLEVVQAIRNNNMAKVPNYDPSHSEHLKKILKGLVRKGTQASQLNVSLEDLLKSRECGRWWIVGSAWSGALSGEKPPQEHRNLNSLGKSIPLKTDFSEKFKKKATKLHLSRPPRINILYAITEGSEDFLDAFEKLLQLSLPTSQERDLFSVILLCSQKGKVYNPFFAHLTNRMCKFDKKYKRLLQFALWDKFQEIESIKPREVANLAKILTYLIGENSLNLTILKHISFMDAESQMISFLRQVLIGLLLHPAGSDTVERVFTELTVSPKFLVLRQSLRIFILKFLNSKKNSENSDHQMLSKRIKDATEILNKGGGVSL